MNILLVAATFPESALLRERLGVLSPEEGPLFSFSHGPHRLHLLHGGIGMVNTAYHVGRYFVGQRPDLAVQFGIGGAFEGEIAVGDAVEVGEEVYAELGAEDGEGFLDLEEMGFRNFELEGKAVYNVLANPAVMLGNAGRRSVTVNRVHGRADSIREVQQIWQPEVENMEGAAFFQCCLLEGIPFAEFRGISNRVEVRNRAAWNIPAAIESVTDLLIAQLDRL